MPHHKQFKKSLKQEAVSALRNKAAKSEMKTAVKKITAVLSKEEAEVALREAISIIDSTARKGIIKKETASRKKSRLTKFVAKIG